jgi:hypothetical protein
MLLQSGVVERPQRHGAKQHLHARLHLIFQACASAGPGDCTATQQRGDKADIAVWPSVTHSLAPSAPTWNR